MCGETPSGVLPLMRRPPPSSGSPVEPTGFAGRLEEVVRRLGTQRNAARAGNISVDSLARYLRAENQPPFPVVVRMATAAGISLDWLATGKSTSGEGAADLEDAVWFQPREDATTPSRDEACPVIAMSRGWLTGTLKLDPEQAALLPVRGDSMAPTLRTEDVALVDCQDRQIDHEDLYALRVSERLLIKRVQVLPTGRLRVCSDHPDYEAFEVPADGLDQQIQVHGQVVWIGKRP